MSKTNTTDRNIANDNIEDMADTGTRATIHLNVEEDICCDYLFARAPRRGPNAQLFTARRKDLAEAFGFARSRCPLGIGPLGIVLPLGASQSSARMIGDSCDLTVLDADINAACTAFGAKVRRVSPTHWIVTKRFR